MKVNRFIAQYVANCVDCEDLIEIDDPAGYIHGCDGIHCVECVDYYAEHDLDDGR